jgi:hypothetical protein
MQNFVNGFNKICFHLQQMNIIIYELSVTEKKEMCTGGGGGVLLTYIFFIFGEIVGC